MLNKIKKYVNDTNVKLSKKVILSTIPVLVIVIFVLSYETNHYYANYKAYEMLNDVRGEVQLKNYPDNNYLVKNQTIQNMESSIFNKLDSLHTQYVKTVEGTEIDKQIKSIKEDKKTNNYEKYTKLKSTVRKDLENNISKIKTNINNFNIEEHDLTSSEETQYEKLLAGNKNIKVEKEELASNLYNDYQEVVKVENKMKQLKVNINEREEAEEQEAEEQAKKEAQKEKEEEAAAKTLDFSNLSSDLRVEGNFDRAIGDSMFSAINAYRSSLGLAPYSYNSSMQSCVDQEAQAYGNTQNPHNWVCPVANENASNAPVGSDAVSISMNFFMTDPPHEAVLSGNYSSVAVSSYVQGGTNYIIVGVF